MNPQKVLQLVIPTPMQALECVGAALIIILAAYWSIITRVVAGGSGISQATLATSLTRQVSVLDTLPYASRVPGIIFWFIVLMTLYIGYLRIHNALVGLYNEYVVATEFTGQPGWAEHLRQIVPRVALYFGFLVFLLLSWKVFGPFWLWLTSQYMWSLFSVHYLAWFLLGLLGIVLNLYGLLITAELILYE